jgi:hypothetical protein
MKKPVLAVDADDVFWNFNGMYVQYHNRIHGTNFTLEDVYTFDMVKMYDLPLKVLLENVYTLVHEEHDSIVPYSDSVQTFSRLSTKYHLHIVTSRAESARTITETALKKHAPGLFSAFHFTNGFSQAGAEIKLTKLEVCRRIGAVGLIEDAPENAVLVAGGGIPVYMPHRPWNSCEHHPELKHPLITPFKQLSELPHLLGVNTA